MLLGGEVLATQDHDVVLADGGAQRVHDGVVDAGAQVDASQLDADVRRQPPHGGTAVRAVTTGVGESATGEDANACFMACMLGTTPRRRQRPIRRLSAGLRIVRSAEVRGAHRFVSVADVDLARVATPLRLVLRVAFVVVVGSAVARGPLDHRRAAGLDPDSVRLSALAIGAIAVLGAAWAVVPRHVLLVATAAAVISLLETSRSGDLGPGFGFFTELVVMPVLLAAVLVRPTRLRWPVAALVVVAAGAVALRAGPGPIRTVLAASMLVLLGAAVAAVVYLHVRENERRTSIAQARENERLDLARELHDIVGHHVTGIVVLAQASRFTGGAEPGSPADRALADIEAAGVETLTSIRRLIGLLRTDPTTSAPPRVADIEHIVDDLRTTHPSTRLVIDDAVRAAPRPGRAGARRSSG